MCIQWLSGLRTHGDKGCVYTVVEWFKDAWGVGGGEREMIEGRGKRLNEYIFTCTC